MGSQFLQEDTVGHCIKGLTKVQVIIELEKAQRELTKILDQRFTRLFVCILPLLNSGEAPGNNRPVSLTSVTGEEDDWEEREGFKKEKSCLINFISFYDDMIGLEEEGRAVYVVYFSFNMVFDTVFYNIITYKLMKY
ncbi:rna-directed dna polymerase from mobile element jockey-like [Limosa lapponica baueri]|uniref:Rna-directed dna polymerase from mobile element jockey-like n=1 Tax=Limosa lapponica baueri TaxID=1758121 RepID=A0A2I0U2V1_LIMLA|nr:rna-directed dna polymerase from mobile element jockey-like [Limosa lapponica baueri]